MLGQNEILILSKKMLAHMRLLSSEILCRKSAEIAQRAADVRETMDRQFPTRWRQAEAGLRGTYESNNGQVHALADSLRESELEHQQLRTDTANERCLHGTKNIQDGAPA